MRNYHFYNSRFAKLLGYNITLYPAIFFIGTPTKDGIAHEMCHVAQIEEVGVIRFYVSYLLYYFAERVRGRTAYKAYKNIPYEEEAYNAQALSQKNSAAKAQGPLERIDFDFESTENNEHMEYK